MATLGGPSRTAKPGDTSTSSGLAIRPRKAPARKPGEALGPRMPSGKGSPDHPYFDEPTATLGSPGPRNPFASFMGQFEGNAGGPGGGGSGGPGGGGGGGGAPAPSFDFSKFKQNIEPNAYQTGAYNKMEDLYDEVPDYFTRALAQSRMAGSEGIENELAAAGSRGFGPTSGFTGSALADYGRKLNQDIMGGQMDAAQQTFADRMGLASGMGSLGTNIAGNLAQMYGNNIGAYNAMANYALGNERNQISWFDSQTRAQQAQFQPMMQMMQMMLQSGLAFI